MDRQTASESMAEIREFLNEQAAPNSVEIAVSNVLDYVGKLESELADTKAARDREIALVNEGLEREKELRRIRHDVYLSEGGWIYQGDGSDHLESLTCPVVVPVEKMREIQAVIDKLNTADMFWDWDDSENCIEDLEEWLFELNTHGYIHRLHCARSLNYRFISVEGHDDDGDPIIREHTLEQWQAQRAAERAAKNESDAPQRPNSAKDRETC